MSLIEHMGAPKRMLCRSAGLDAGRETGRETARKVRHILGVESKVVEFLAESMLANVSIKLHATVIADRDGTLRICDVTCHSLSLLYPYWLMHSSHVMQPPSAMPAALQVVFHF